MVWEYIILDQAVAAFEQGLDLIKTLELYATFGQKHYGQQTWGHILVPMWWPLMMMNT